VQRRRLQLQYSGWMVAQNPKQFKPIDDPDNSYGLAGVHRVWPRFNAGPLNARMLPIWWITSVVDAR
jgi:hypothetical protein